MTYDRSFLRLVRFWFRRFASGTRRANPMSHSATARSGPVTPTQTVTLRYAKLRLVTVSYGRLRSKFLQPHHHRRGSLRQNRYENPPGHFREGSSTMEKHHNSSPIHPTIHSSGFALVPPMPRQDIGPRRPRLTLAPAAPTFARSFSLVDAILTC